MAARAATDAAKLRDTLVKYRGNMSATGRALRVSRQAVRERVEASEDLKFLVVELREARVDNAEDKLDKAVSKGEPWAIALTLRTLGKGRGYVERNETSGPDGGPVQTVTRVIFQYDDGNVDGAGQDS